MLHSLNSHKHSLYLFSSVRKRRFTGKPRNRIFRIPVYLLCFITDGEGVVLIDGMLCKVRPFELYLLVPGMIVEMPEHSNVFKYYGVFFQPLTLTKAKGNMGISSSIVFSDTFQPGRIPVLQPEQILQRILQMYEISRNERKKDSLSLRLQLEQLIDGIMNQVPETDERSDERINQTITYIEQHYIDKISIGKLAEVAGMVPVAYSRLFLRVIGSTPVEYLNTFRMDKAKQLLDQNHNRVKEVAASVGFRSEFYFSRMFQRSVGVPPTLFMKRRTLRVAVASSLGFQQYLQAVGIEPVCVLDLFHYPGLSDNEYAERFCSQCEELKQSAPNLIIADQYHMEFREFFKEIAFPVIFDLSIWDWKKNFLQIAELLGRERIADQTLSHLELRSAEVKEALQQTMGKRRITIMQVSHQSIRILGTAGHPLNELIYGDLDLKPGVPEIRDIWRQEMPPESLPLLETEYLFIHKHHVLAGSESMFQRLVQTNRWIQIPAVQNNNVKLIQNWFAMSWTPLGRQMIMDELLEI